MKEKTTMEFTTKVRNAFDAGIIRGDGHTLFAPEFYEPHFTKEELKDLIQIHKSDGSPKGTIFADDGSVIDKVEAIYNLNFLYWVCARLEIDKSPRAQGRGSQAQELVRFIIEELEKE